MKLLVLTFIVSNLFAQTSMLNPGKRGNGYRVWVYFDERDQENYIDLDPASIKRRQKHGINKTTKYDYKIKQYYLDALKKTGVKLKNKSRWLNAVSVIANKDQISLIEKLTFVSSIRPVYQHKKKKF